MNVKLLRKVKKHILEEPKRLEMGDYINLKKEGDDIFRSYPRCGTAACIAGWACVLKFGAEKAHDLQVECHEQAGKLLGLTRDQSTRLFLPGNWPFEFERGCFDDGKKKTAEVAAARIEHFIKTKGRE